MDNLLNVFEKAVRIEADTHLTQDQKDLQLAQLMTAMELRYKIPMFRDEQWEKDNPKIIHIYREISEMRKL